MATSKSFARVRVRSWYRRKLKEDEKNWKITAPVVRESGAQGFNQTFYNDGEETPKHHYDFSEQEFTREMGRKWKRED